MKDDTKDPLDTVPAAERRRILALADWAGRKARVQVLKEGGEEEARAGAEDAARSAVIAREVDAYHAQRPPVDVLRGRPYAPEVERHGSVGLGTAPHLPSCAGLAWSGYKCNCGAEMQAETRAMLDAAEAARQAEDAAKVPPCAPGDACDTCATYGGQPTLTRSQEAEIIASAPGQIGPGQTPIGGAAGGRDGRLNAPSCGVDPCEPPAPAERVTEGHTHIKRIAAWLRSCPDDIEAAIVQPYSRERAARPLGDACDYLATAIEQWSSRDSELAALPAPAADPGFGTCVDCDAGGARRSRLAADIREIAAWHEEQANKNSWAWSLHTNAASKCYAAANRIEHEAAPQRPGLTEEQARALAEHIGIKLGLAGSIVEGEPVQVATRAILGWFASRGEAGPESSEPTPDSIGPRGSSYDGAHAPRRSGGAQ